MGMLDLCPNIVVDQSTFVTSLKMRGRNHILKKRRAFSTTQNQQNRPYAPMVCSVVLSVSDFIICSRRIVRPRLLGHNSSGHSLYADTVSEPHATQPCSVPQNHAGSRSPKAAGARQCVQVLHFLPRSSTRPRRNAVLCLHRQVRGYGLNSVKEKRLERVMTVFPASDLS